jgi:hypothetical protein
VVDSVIAVHQTAQQIEGVNLMKNILKQLVCLALALSCLLTASGAMAASVNTATINMPSSEWEENFLKLLAYAEDNDLKMTDNPVFSVTELPNLDGGTGFEHSLELAGFMKIAYYDYGDDMFNSAALTIDLDHGGASEEFAWMAGYFTVLAGDMDTSWEEFQSLMEALCPIFSEVFSGQERVNGGQAATLRGVGYGMEINDTERFIRLLTNAQLTRNDE